MHLAMAGKPCSRHIQCQTSIGPIYRSCMREEAPVCAVEICGSRCHQHVYGTPCHLMAHRQELGWLLACVVRWNCATGCIWVNASSSRYTASSIAWASVANETLASSRLPTAVPQRSGELLLLAGLACTRTHLQHPAYPNACALAISKSLPE